MNFEELQKTWQDHNHEKGSLDPDLLLNEVRRNQLTFRQTIFWRDVREVGVAALLVPVFLYGGWKNHWTLYLNAFSCFVIGAFMLVDRHQQKKRMPDSHSSLKDFAATSLAEVSHQIWLLKNILWWYLLPLAVPLLLFFCWGTWNSHSTIGTNVLQSLGSFAFVAIIYGGIYWLNQFAVKKQLEPRRLELQKLLGGLESAHSAPVSRKRPLGPLLLVLAATAASVIVYAFVSGKREPGVRNDQNQNVPGLAVVATQDGRICDRTVSGVRKWGDTTPITTNDIFHIGSCTKSMTATLAALFIEDGKLNWDTTIADVFPELKGKMDSRYERVTVEQLLQHRGGVPHNPPPAAWKRAWQEIGTPVQQRREFIESVLSAPPQAEPGMKKIYSNDGYVIVGTMLEKISGQDFESLMTEKLFRPLQMDTAGFGAPGIKGKTDQPWGHTRTSAGIVPTQADNPPVYSPCGRVHCSLDDLARYAIFHLHSEPNQLLKPATLNKLHASPENAKIENPLDDYACGWVRLKRSWGGGTVLWHNGSNTMWYIVMWLAPEKNFSVIAATNIAGPEAEKACDDAAVAMIKKWL